MKPGREIDALVAEKVMGFRTGIAVFETGSVPVILDKFTDIEVPFYSTDIAAAWTVVEKTGLLKSQQLFQQSSGKWIIGNLDTQDGLLILCAEAETASAVICLAALKAMGVEI